MSEDVHQLIARAGQALRAVGAAEVYLFGSAARGPLRDESDVDLAVAGLPPARFLEAMAQATEILCRPVDLVDLDEDTPFTRYLREEGELRRVA
jgi:predicted nucleotidyltransferase